MDFRKVWEPWEIARLAESLGMGGVEPEALWRKKGFVDGDNSGSAAFDWAAQPGASVEEILSGVALPLADPGYFPGLGNSVTFVSPAGIRGIAGRMAYSATTNLFSMVWDEAETVALPEQLSQAVCATSSPTWPHTFVVPKYATMGEYKQYAPANHFHMTWGLAPGAAAILDGPGERALGHSLAGAPAVCGGDRSARAAGLLAERRRGGGEAEEGEVGDGRRGGEAGRPGGELKVDSGK